MKYTFICSGNFLIAIRKLFFVQLFILAANLVADAQPVLYGLTAHGGYDDVGAIIKYSAGTGNLVTLKNFDDTRLSSGVGFVKANDGKLYSVTGSGGASGYGTIYYYDPATDIYKKVKDFDNINGRSPQELMQAANGKLYGMTFRGGVNDRGTIFSYDPVTNILNKLKDFDITNGYNPAGRLTQADNGKIYGMTSLGGINDRGTIFSYDPITAIYSKLKDFDVVNSINGSNPGGSLLKANDGKLYGSALGGANNQGVIFSFDPGSNSYTKLIDLVNATGTGSTIELMQAADLKLYGVTYGGGSSGKGVIFSYDPVNNIYSKVKDFDNINGSYPIGKLVQVADGTLYGMTSGGGTFDRGVIFSYNLVTSAYIRMKDFDNTTGIPNGSLTLANNGKFYGIAGGMNIFSYDPASSNYKNLKTFTGLDGLNPFGSLVNNGNGKLYGMTFGNGGGSFGGMIFSYEPATNIYTRLKIFSDLNQGAFSKGSLIKLNNGKLYAMTQFGGASGVGVIFSYDPVTNTYSKLWDFNTTNGAYPIGDLLQTSDGKLYGMASGGGTAGAGVIFSFDPSSNIYTKLKDFDNTNGGSPQGSLIQASDGKLYGITQNGGSVNGGVIFSYDPVTLDYNKLIDLTEGILSQGSLKQALNGKLYGMTRYGGTSGGGIIFSYDYTANIFSKLKDFDNANGSSPLGSLMQASDEKLYGMTSEGGANNLGVAFSFDPVSSVYTKLKDFDGLNGGSPVYNNFIELNSCTQAAPVIGTVTQPSCAVSTGSVILNGLPASGTWTINPGTIAGTGTSTTISGLAAGTYNFVLTNAAGCISDPSANVVINPQPITPSTPAIGTITQPTCAIPTGSAVLNSLPGTGTWTINPGGITGTGTSITISGLAAGTYNFIVTNIYGCTSAPSANAVVNPILNVDAVNNQTVCNNTATSAINFTGPVPGTIYNWTNNNPSIGLPASGTGNIASFTATNTTNAPVIATVSVTASSPGFAYIPSIDLNNVSVINTVTNSVIATIQVGNSPYGVSISPDGSRVYIGNRTGGNVSVINTSANTVVATIPVGSYPLGISASPDGSRVYVANAISNNISVINTSTNSVVATIPVGSFPFGISVSPDGSRVYVANSNSNTVTVINTSTSTVLTTIPVGSVPNGVSVSPDGSRVYVTSGSNSLSVINTITNSVVATISVGSAPSGISVSPDGSRVYLANYNSNSLSVINTSVNAVVATIPVGSSPSGTSVSSDGSRVYVVNNDPGTVSVINTSSNSVIATIPLGGHAYSFGNFLVRNTVCPASAKTFIITVNPTPTITVSTITQPTCSTPTGSVILTGLPATGTWTINPGVITGVGTSTSISGLAAGTYNFTVTNAVGCTSTPSGNVVINVPPVVPSVDAVSNQVVCNNKSTTAINFTGPLPGTVFNWTNNNTSIGLAASGTGNIASFTATNTTNSPVTATIEVTPSLPGFAYIPNVNSNNVSVINTATNAVVATITAGTSPFGVSVSPDGSLVYVTNNGSNNLSVINTTTNSVVATIPVGTSPRGVSVSPDGSRVYVTNTFSNNVSVINTATNSVIATIPLGVVGPYGVSVSPDGSRVYVANYSSNNVSVINTATNSIISTIPMAGPYGISVSPDGSRVYVTNYSSNNISVINTATNTILATIPVGTNPFGLSVSPDGSRIYVANAISNNVSVINTFSNTVIATIPVGLEPHGVSVSSDGSRVYVANSNNQNVSVINTSANSVVTTISVGINPVSFGNFISRNSVCPASAQTFTITVNPTPVIIVSTITQPTCATPTGSVLLTGLPASGTWTINPGVITGTGTSTTISGLAAGTYNFSVINAAGCTSAPSANVFINTAPGLPTITAPTLIQPTCAIPSGTIIINASGAGTLEYSVDNGTNWQLNSTFSNLAAGSYTIKVRFQGSTCIANYSGNPVVINAAQCNTKTIPGRIEAESFDAKNGGQYAVPTNDAGGGQQVIGISNGSWMDYNVTVTQSGTYTVNFRVATTQSTAQFQIKLGNTVLGTINIPNTGGWDTWITVPVTNVSLTAGVQTIRILSTNNETCNLNWMDWILTGGGGSNIIVTGSLTPFTACAGTASSEQTFTVAGTNLTGNLTVTAPAGFEVSLTPGTGFAASVPPLTASGGTVNPTTIYVRMSASATGAPSGNIACASTGATTQNIAASGTVNNAPIITAPNVTQPTCAIPTGTIVVNATGSGTLEYSISNGANWFASATFSSLAAGSYNIKVRPQASPACVSTYANNPVVLIAATGCGQPTTTIINSDLNPSCAGSLVNFTATVTSSGNPVTTGTVTFTEGATILANNVAVNGSGQAFFSTSSLTAASHMITATYNGTASFATSNNSIVQTVNSVPATPLITGNTAFCTGGSTTLSITPVNGESYCWRNTATAPTWNNVGNAGFSTGFATYQSLSFNGSTPYVAYQDYGNGQKTTVMKFDGTNWVNVGNPGFSAGIAQYQSLKFNGSIPYVAYQDGGNGSKTTVMKFNGSSWENVGNPGFSAGIAKYQSLAFNGSTPYIAYQDGGNGNKTTVMKFDGMNWINIGNAGFSAGLSLYQSLSFSGSTPYVAYKDFGNGAKTTVMKFDGTNWVNVGNAGFSAGVAETQSLFVSGSTPYVAYEDFGNGAKTTVMKFDGTNWVNVGNAGFSTGIAEYQSLSFIGSIPYVAYRDVSSGPKTTVMKFDGTNWVSVGNVGFSIDDALYQNLSFNGSTLYVAYEDIGTGQKITVMKFDVPCAGTGSSYNVSTVGNYTVTATNANGCTAVSNPIVVTVNPIPATPIITLGGPTTFCAGGSVTLTSSSATGNQWYLNGNAIGGATNQTYVATASGTYTVIVTTSGCSSIGSAGTTITVNPTPTITALTVTQPSCAIPSGTIIVNASGAGTLEYSIDNGTNWQLNSTFSNLAAGSYTIKVRFQGSTCIASYSGNPVVINAAACNGKTIPGRIEAESFDAKNGGQYAVPTNDAGGGQQVIGISNGSWMDYNVTVTQTGTYTVNFRVATTQVNAQFQIKLGNTVLGTINIPNTGGWDTWVTVPVTNVSLTAGVQTIRILSTNNETCNFNWMDWVLTGGGGSNIIVTGTLTPFTACGGTASSEQTFTVSGTNLTGNLTVTAPAGFELSLTPGTGFAASVPPLTASGGTVNTTTIYVRMSASATGTPSGNIACASTGATTQNVAASGTVNTAPIITAPNVTQPTCATPTGTIVVNATGSGTLEYSVNNGANWFASATFSSLAAGSYNIKVRLQASPACVSTYANNPVVLIAATGCCVAPTITSPTVTQPTCAILTGTIAVNATGSETLEYSINNGANWFTSATFTNLAVGSYNIKVRLQASQACISTYASNPVVLTAATGCCVNGQIVVTNSNNAGTGSLRQAVIDACPGGTITFDPAFFNIPRIITLTTGEIMINKNLTITGPGANLLSVSGNNNSRVFYISSGAVVDLNNPVTVSIENLKVTEGNDGNNGGGIYVADFTVFNLNNSVISYNHSRGGNGGGIYGSQSTLNLTNSTISNNGAASGGGISIYRDTYGGILRLTNSTVSHDSASGGGGIILQNLTNATIINSTISDNIAFSAGGGILNLGTLTLTNSIVANCIPSDCFNSGNGTINAQYSLIEDGLGSITGTNTNNLTGDPVLGPLANNGGPTFTHALLPGSPAIDKGSAVAGITTDQRGIARPYDNPSVPNASGGNGSDIGAYEAGPSAVPTANAGPNQIIILPTNQVTLAGSGIANNGGSIISHVWSKFSGGTANITNTADYNTTVTGLSAGTYVFRLTVTQNDNQEATSDVTITVNASNGKLIPGRIEAESFDAKNGGQYAVPTNDAGGGQQVIGISNGSWMDYNVTVTQSGRYTVNFRVATTQNNAQFQLKLGSTVLGTVSIPNTGGWDNWQIATVNNILLTAGVQTIRIESINNETCNFNWMDWLFVSTSVAPVTITATKPSAENDIKSSNLLVSVFPNPSSSYFNLKVQARSVEQVTIRIVDIAGRQVQELKGIPGQTFRFGDRIVNGTYLVEVRQGSEKVVTKVIKQ